MPSAVRLREDYSAKELRALARRSKDVNQSRRLLSLASVRDGMDRRRFEIATIAAARARSSTYCTAAHSKFLRDVCGDADAMESIATHPDGGELDPQDRAVYEFAGKVATDASAVQQQDVDRLRAAGLSDADVADVVFAAACFPSVQLTIWNSVAPRLHAAYDLSGDGKTVITLRQLHPTKAQRDAKIGFGAVEYGYQTLEKLARHVESLRA